MAVEKRLRNHPERERVLLAGAELSRRKMRSPVSSRSGLKVPEHFHYLSKCIKERSSKPKRSYAVYAIPVFDGRINEMKN